jgi:peroxiredoxin
MALLESDSELAAGDRAPPFDLPDADGGRLALDDVDERALLVVFTCNHCPYAQAKFDLLNDLAADYDDAAVVGINPNDADEYPDDSFERMQALVADGTIAYDAYLRDESQDVARAYGAVCTPDPFLFARGDTAAAEEVAVDPAADGYCLVYHGRLDDALDPDAEPSRFQSREAIDAVLAGEAVDLEWQPSQGCSIKWADD